MPKRTNSQVYANNINTDCTFKQVRKKTKHENVVHNKKHAVHFKPAATNSIDHPPSSEVHISSLQYIRAQHFNRFHQIICNGLIRSQTIQFQALLTQFYTFQNLLLFRLYFCIQIHQSNELIGPVYKKYTIIFFISPSSLLTLSFMKTLSYFLHTSGKSLWLFYYDSIFDLNHC